MTHPIAGNLQSQSQFGEAGSPSPIYLTILRNGNTNIVDLAEVGSLIPRSETQVDGTFLRELGAEIARLAMLGYSRQANRDASDTSTFIHTTTQDLQQVGELIFSHLLTEPARKKLRTTEPCDLYLRLDEQLIQVPWELCYDGQDFLSTKFRVGRQVITAYPIRETPLAPRQDGPVRILLIADPTESLPQANIEAERLCTLLDRMPGAEVTLMGGKEVRKVRLLAEVQAHDVVHFAGHSYYDAHNPRSSGWRLHDGVLAAGELSKLSRPPLLVFSNSCQAGATAEWDGNPRYEGQAFGIGSAFLLAGVKNFIGTFWIANDEESFLFAAAFYQGLSSGSSLGEALLHARQEIIGQKGSESLTWASYMLYGDPAVRLFASDRNDSRQQFKADPPPSQRRPSSPASAPRQPSHARNLSFSSSSDQRMNEPLQRQPQANNSKPPKSAATQKSRSRLHLLFPLSLGALLLAATAGSFLLLQQPPKPLIDPTKRTLVDTPREVLEAPPRVAVLAFDSKAGGSADLPRYCADSVFTRLARTGKFVLVEREKISTVLVEQDFGASGRVDTTSAARLGELLGAEYIVTGSIENLGKGCKQFGGYGVTIENCTYSASIAVKVIDTTSGAVLYSDRGSSSQTTKGTNYLSPGGASYRSLLNTALQQVTPGMVKRLETAVSTARLAREQIILDVDSDPRGADVEFDGAFIGNTPVTLKVSEGVHRIRLSRQGYQVWEKMVKVVEGVTVKPTLERQG